MNRRKFIKRYVKTGAAGLLLPTIFIPKLLAADSYAPHRRRAFRPVAAAGGVAFSDDFNRANGDSLGANWTEAAGDLDIVGNTMECLTLGWGENIAAYTGTSCGSVNQYVKATFVTSGTASARYPCIVFRYTNASSPMYKIFFWIDENQITFTRAATAADGSYEVVQTVTSITLALTDTVGATITGLGNNVEVRCWINPTGLPTSATDWNGDTTPDATFTTNPTTPIDTGNFVGLGGEIGNVVLSFDNFFGGGLS